MTSIILRSRKLRLLVGGFGSLLFIVGATLFVMSGTPSAKVKNCATTSDYSECLSELMLNTMNTHPDSYNSVASAVYTTANSYKTIDLRDLSETAHFAGMALASQGSSLSNAVNICGTSFKSGCLHGFVMDDIEHTMPGVKNAAAMLAYCDPLKTAQALVYDNCIHGVGHELWAKSSDTLNISLASCDAAPSGAVRTACLSGQFMEYTKNDALKGSHSHSVVGTRMLPCNDLSVAYQQDCYATAGSYLQYTAGNTSFSTTYAYCAALASNYRSSCSLAVTDRLLVATGGNTAQASRHCQQLSGRFTAQCNSEIATLGRTIVTN